MTGMENHMGRSIKNFTFSTASSKDSKHDLEMRKEALTSRLDKLDERCAIEGPTGKIPIISSIMDISQDYEQIKKLGKGLQRAAEILPELNEVEEKLTVINIITSNENWFLSTFADLSKDVDKWLSINNDEDIEDTL